MLGTDYPFPLGEVKIVDTYPGKVVLESRHSESIKVPPYYVIFTK